MKAWKTLFAVLGAALALASLIGCGEAKYLAKPNEELYGTWQNEAMGFQKMALASESFKAYRLATDINPLSAGTMVITSKWADANGNVWYKAYQTVTASTGGSKGTKWQVLYQVGKSGEVLEAINTPVTEFDPKAFPVKLDPKSSAYGVYQRRQDYSPRRVLIGDIWTEGTREGTR